MSGYKKKSSYFIVTYGRLLAFLLPQSQYFVDQATMTDS